MTLEDSAARPISAYRCATCSQGWAVPGASSAARTLPDRLSVQRCPKDGGVLVRDDLGLRASDYIDFLVMDAFNPGSTADLFQ